MNNEDRKTIILVTGFILVSVGIFTYMFPYSNYVTGILVGITYPYRTYSFPLCVVGFALISVGYLLEKQGKKATTNE